MAALWQYLERHAEAEVQLAARIEERFDHALVVPALGEQPGMLDGWLEAAPPSARTLAIVVVNASDEHDAATLEKNRTALAALRARSEAGVIDEGAWHGRLGALSLLLLDRSSMGRRIPRREGVGLARKIGCDVALALSAAGRLGSRWIHTSDADAELPRDYCAAAQDAPDDAVVLTYPFVHVASGDERLDRAHAIYETFLRYYVLGLGRAGSPYAQHCIGSTLAVDASAYATVRGFPRREAAEDFYMVNKLRKIGPSFTPRAEPIRIRARRSDRVPFGTGRATGAMLASGRDAGAGYEVMHPRCFELLAAWLQALERLAADARCEAVELACDSLDARDRDPLARALTSLDARAACAAAAAGAPPARRLARLHEWFDAFRTRKLLHALRDAGIGMLAWNEALAAAPFCPQREPPSDPFEAARQLAEQERAQRR